MEDFLQKSCEVLSLKYEHLRNLSGLKVLNLRKIEKPGLLQGAIASMDQLLKAHH
jgi:hypothetical protein